MRAVWIGVPEHFLEERHRLGIDECDELWDGVLHMVPPPSRSHSSVNACLTAALVAIARRRNLVPHADPIGLFQHDKNYRVPDGALAKPEHLTDRGLISAELVIELLSPHDEAREKFGFYAERKVREIWLVTPETRDVEIHFLVEGVYERRATSHLDIEMRVEDGTLYITDGDVTHEV